LNAIVKHIITRISSLSRPLEWRLAGTVFLSTGAEGSRAKHLTIEFYTVVMLLTFKLIISSIPHPLTLSF